MSPALSARLTRLAAARLAARHPEWAAAMIGEEESLQGGVAARWAWAIGTARASLALSPPDGLYLAALPLAVAAMVAYQWNADEGPVTLMLICVLGAGLGVLRPRRFILSGLAVGAVVATVNGFERLSGVRPAYETHIHTLPDCLRWLMLTAPALIAAFLGGRARLGLQKETPQC